MDDKHENVPGQQHPMALRKANTILLWRKAFRTYNDKERNNPKLTNEVHKTYNEMNHQVLESAGINKDDKSPTYLGPSGFRNLKLFNTEYMTTTEK